MTGTDGTQSSTPRLSGHWQILAELRRKKRITQPICSCISSRRSAFLSDRPLHFLSGTGWGQAPCWPEPGNLTPLLVLLSLAYILSYRLCTYYLSVALMECVSVSCGTLTYMDAWKINGWLHLLLQHGTVVKITLDSHPPELCHIPAVRLCTNDKLSMSHM